MVILSVNFVNFANFVNYAQRVIEKCRESQIKLWIWKVLNEISELDYDQYLRDGVVLCRYLISWN